jgi:hypothetical protein
MNNSAPTFGGGRMSSGGELREIDGAVSRGYNIISDRLFIAEVMSREKVRDLWLAVVKQQNDPNKFWSEWSALYKALLETARRDLKLKA